MVSNTIDVSTLREISEIQTRAVAKLMRNACSKIAPVWPLENFVAVNPYLGLSDKSFDDAAQLLNKAGSIQMTLPVSFYLDKLKEGAISLNDIAAALNERGEGNNISDFLSELHHPDVDCEPKRHLSTVSDVLTVLTKKDWNRFMVNRISAWAASYFDTGQAGWSAAGSMDNMFVSWKNDALADYTIDIMGLKGFRKSVSLLPDRPLEAAHEALETLGIPENGIELYLHSLLLRVGGWSAHAARIDWDSKLYGGEDGKLNEFLAILISWEACLYKGMKHPDLEARWQRTRQSVVNSSVGNEDAYLNRKLILQRAFDLSAQRQIIQKFKLNPVLQTAEYKPQLAQAVFCIDVRSEVFRRNLEAVDPNIETLGFAGFFAFPIKFFPVGRSEGEAQCPVLLKTGPNIIEEITDDAPSVVANRLQRSHQVKHIWKSFKTGAVTCFGFVSPLGLSYLPKLLTDSFGFTRPVAHPEKLSLNQKSLDHRRVRLSVEEIDGMVTGIALEDQVAMARNALKAMSLTVDFAKFVLIVGHGSTTVNNPYATGLDCGACGGHSGESNAKVAAAVLNNPEVRISLAKDRIAIPDSTTFLACLHDTTTDQITIFNGADVPVDQYEAFETVKSSLSKAGSASRAERSVRLAIGAGSNIDKAVMARSKDWAQVRPEWGLAGCSAFVVAPRERTRHIDLCGKSFLHSYKWREDKGFSVLELIMTAPMVVTSWISLQYYASTVDNKVYGSGNKTLHNVTSGIGVLEGYAGDLRVGLPWQSVHDGERFQHEPLRLNVVIEAPVDAINSILDKHDSVRNLVDNQWISLMVLDENGMISHRYVGGLTWEAVSQIG